MKRFIEACLLCLVSIDFKKERKECDIMKKRYIAIYAIICMLVSSVCPGLTLKGNVLNVHAASEAQTIPFELDFEGQTQDTTPEGWSLASVSDVAADADKSSMLVVSDSDNTENNVAKVNQTAARSSYYYMLYSFEATDKVVLEYDIKVESSAKDILLPTIAYSGEKDSPLNLYMSAGTNSIQYAGTRSYWKSSGSKLSEGKWNTIKMVVDLKQNVRELWINGSPITLDETVQGMADYPCNSEKTLGNVLVGFMKTSTGGTYYIDNVSVDTVTEVQKIPFEVNFEGQTEDTTPKGWNLAEVSNVDADAGKCSMLVVSDSDDPENNVAKVNQAASRGSYYYMLYPFEAADKVVLEYDIKVESSASHIFLPTIAYSGEKDSPLNLYMSAGTSSIQYAGTRSYWKTSGIVLNTDAWNTIKMVVDVKQNVRELWVNGSKVTLDETVQGMANYPCNSEKTLGNVLVGFYKEASNSTYYIDNVSVKKFVEGESLTFEQTQLTLPVNCSVTLKPNFTPTDTTNQEITYTSSDTTVATVDEDGKVTAVGVGSATITATSNANNTISARCAVTVTAEASVSGTAGTKNYGTLQAAIDAAKAGDTITLLDNVTASADIEIASGVTLDLNGYTLDMDDNYLYSFGDVVDNSGKDTVDVSDDKAGRLKIATVIVDVKADGNTKSVVKPKGTLAENNSQMPVYIANEGYMLATMTAQALTPVIDTDYFTSVSRPSFGDPHYERLQRGASAAKLQFILRLDWSTVTGNVTNTYYQEFSYSDDLVQNVYTNGKAFSVMVNGLTNYASSMKVSEYVKSDLGVVLKNNSFSMNATSGQ